MRTIKAVGGPIDGKSITVAPTQGDFSHHADSSGHYHVTKSRATWKDGAVDVNAEPVDFSAGDDPADEGSAEGS